jgi:hypothetical protein
MWQHSINIYVNKTPPFNFLMNIEIKTPLDKVMTIKVNVFWQHSMDIHGSWLWTPHTIC